MFWRRERNRPAGPVMVGAGCGPAAERLAGSMRVVRRSADLTDALAALPGRALVPTMGALHAGHLALVAAARAAGPVVASIFVNPLQFGPGEDLARYPRDEAGDLAALDAAGCALAFLPSIDDVYPDRHATVIEVAGPAEGYEGARRPGHFRGVATVVARLFGLVGPRTAWFGQKDWQQLQVVRRMTADLALQVEIRDVATLRDADGLALSSRNRFLTAAEREVAPVLARQCAALAAALRAGAAVAPAIADCRAALDKAGLATEYLDAVDPERLLPLAEVEKTARLIVAARLGSVRLLDNFPI